MSEPTSTLKIITPSKETEESGQEPISPQEREVTTVAPHSSSNESDFVLDYREQKGRPYIADMLGVPFLYSDRLDVHSSKKDMETIDDWVMLEIQRKGLNGRKDSYKEIIDGLSKKLKLHKSISPGEKIKSLAILLKKALETQKYYSKMGVDLKSLEELYGGI